MDSDTHYCVGNVSKNNGVGGYKAIIRNDYSMINGARKKTCGDYELLAEVRFDLGLDRLGLVPGLESMAMGNVDVERT